MAPMHWNVDDFQLAIKILRYIQMSLRSSTQAGQKIATPVSRSHQLTNRLLRLPKLQVSRHNHS